MTNLEAYFRIYGIKIAQETFPKQKPIEPIGIGADLQKILDFLEKYEKEHSEKIGISERLQGEPKQK